MPILYLTHLIETIMETPCSKSGDSNGNSQLDIITIPYYVNSLFTASPYLVMSSMIDSDQYREECSSYDSRYLKTTSPPWISLSKDMQALIRKELQYMFFEETASYLRSVDDYVTGWYATWDLPVARYRQPAQVKIDRDEIFKFFNKNIAIYIDTATVGEMDLGYLGRYLYRAWLHLYKGRPPFQRGGFFAKPLRLSKELTGSLNALSSFHRDLTDTLSVHLDDLAQFEQGGEH
ncbi:hypothetical protein F25303_8742 [Fusarium sp. NRRL 25303]|nr:hypothetical protein F25303_8742 [Fusarium sp. NRRL 25303]